MDQDLDIDGSEDEEEITAQAVLKSLESAWLNEKFSPEILPHNNEMVECMLGQIQHMERNINKLPKTDLRLFVHKMELSRIKYIISSYLRTRLKKIETYAIPIINDERIRSETDTNYLTPAELKYAQSFVSNMENHMKTAALDQMPGNMQNFDPKKLAIFPNVNSHVFLKANETVNGVVLEGLTADQDEEIDLEGQVKMRKLKGGNVKETAKQKRERKQEFAQMRKQINTIVLPTVGVVFLLICVYVFIKTRPQSIQYA